MEVLSKNFYFFIKIENAMMKLKKTLLIVGLLIVIVTFFAPLSHSCKSISGSDEEFVSTTKFGFEKITYYISLFFIILIIYKSYFGKSTYVPMLFYTLIGGFITVFINTIGQAGLGRPCGDSPTQFQNLLYLSHILIITSCFIQLVNNHKFLKAHQNN